MITGEDINRCYDEQEKVGKQLMVIDTMQYFEISIPKDIDPEEYLNSDECKQECAALILNQTTDLKIHRVYQKYNTETEEWEDA